MALLLLLGASGARAQATPPLQPPKTLKKLSLDQLFDIEVTTVSQRPESLSKTAAAVHVVTAEDIRRMGALSIPEALRYIPGIEVAQIDSRQYAITSRGFNGSVANKLLVLIDGRSVYTPLFSGVFWDVQDVLMEDIERIEVIRGPGATVWGANAVNGVINIITKDAGHTQGLLLTGGAGNWEKGFGGIRYGGALGSKAFYRLYAKHFDRDDSELPNGQEAGDDWWMGQGGLRLDWSPSPADGFSLQGDGYGGHGHQPVGEPTDLAGGNGTARWTRSFSARSDLQVGVYYDRTDRDIPPIFHEILDIYDVSLRHRFPAWRRHDIVWGLGFRHTRDDVENSPGLAFLPPRLTRNVFSGFVQDELSFVDNRLRVTFGSKIEHNDYTGVEVQPSGRFSWSASKTGTLWGALSRAVRTPSRLDRDLFVPGTPPYFLAGGPNFDSEVLYAYELGYKFQLAGKVTGSLASFYNVYDKLRSLEMGSPAFLANGLKGRIYGAGNEVSWQPTGVLRLNAGYTFLRVLLERKPGSTDVTQLGQEGDSPRHQAYVRSMLDLGNKVTADFSLRYVGELPHQKVPDYLAGDAHLGWQPVHGLELGAYGRNLFDRRHPEFGTPATRREVPRSVFGKATWQF